MRQYFETFSPAQYFGCDGSDPEDGLWADWIEGQEPKIDPEFAHFLWWHLCGALHEFAFPSNHPEGRGFSYETPEEFEEALNWHIALLETLLDEPVRLLQPFRVEGHLIAVDGVEYNPIRVMLAYSAWCADKGMSAMLAGNSPSAAMGAAYAIRAFQLANEYIERFSRVQAFSARDFQRELALKRHAHDPKQAEKASVYASWLEWRERPHLHKGKAAFARAMLDMHQHLESTKVIEDWCRAWERERKGGTSPNPAAR